MSPLVRLGAVRLLLDVQFWFPVWLILLLDRGFSLGEAALVDGLFRVVVVAAELPMGKFADRLGRKRTVILVCLATSVVFTAIGLVNTLPVLVITWIAWGLLWALASGVDTAYSWELAQQERPGHAQRYLGRTRAITGTAGVISLLTAGWLYDIAPGLPFWATAALAALALLIALTLPDIDPERVGTAAATATSSLRMALSDPSLRNAVALAAVVLATGWSLQILVQPLALQLGLAPASTGVVYAVFAVAGGLGGVLGARSARVSQPWVPLSMLGLALACVGIGLLIRSELAILSIVVLLPIIGILHALAKTVTDIWVAQISGPRVLASVFSVVSLIGGLVIAVARPGLVVLSGVIGAGEAFAVWGAVSMAGMAACLLLWRRRARAAVAASHPYG
ncbi:MAG: MFS transporter [Brachybacterium sp.]|uniref:MFS transporter n=1 Tax=unclassified Brachybacterium TaxID=2623841 RepID=UPI003F97D584